MMNAIERFGNISMPLPSGKDSLFFRFQQSGNDARDAEVVSSIINKYGGQNLTFAETKEQSEEIWSARKAALWSAMALVPGGACYTTDVCVPVGNLPQLVRETQEDLSQSNIVGPIIGQAEPEYGPG